MRFMVRWLFRLTLLGIVLGVATILLKDTVLKSLTEHRMRQETGLEVRIGRMETGLFDATLTLQDLKIFNPPEFGGGPMIYMPEIHLEWDAQALARQNLHLSLARIHLAELTVVRNKEGRSNLDLLAHKVPAITNLSNQPSVLNGWTFTGVDVLNLTIERLRVVDLNNPAKPYETNLGLNHEILRNVRSLADVMTPLTTRFLEKSLSSLFKAPASARPQTAPKPDRLTNAVPPR
jgi:hypothetical protein